MSGISSKAAGIVENKKKYNGIEFENDLDLNIYDAQFRELDAQTGKWWQVDPKTDQMYMWSTYASNFDNPIRYEDPLGDIPEACCKGLWDAVVESTDQVMASASGLLWGSLNTITGGLVSTDPFNIRPALNPSTQQIFDNSITLGKFLPLFSPGSKGAPKVGTPEIVPVGGKPGVTIPVSRGVVTPDPVVAPTVVNAEHTSNARPSTKHDHQIGQARLKQQREGSKGMKEPPRKRPPGHKGPWPQKKAPPPPPTPPPTST
jgi:RHS repeat-associated protein